MRCCRGAFIRLFIVSCIMNFAVVSGAVGQVRVKQLDEVIPFDAEQPAIGAWVGQVRFPDEDASFAHLDIARADTAGRVTATATIAGLGAVRAVGENIRLDGRRFSLTIETPRGVSSISGTVSDDGQTAEGALELTPAGGAEQSAATFSLVRLPRIADLPDAAAYTGTASLPNGMAVDMAIVLASTPGGNWVGHVDIPLQQLREIPLLEIRREGSHFEANIPLSRAIHLEGEFDDENRRLVGVMRQASLELKLDLARDRNYVYRTLPRPQNPTPPYPYRQREVIANHPSGHVLAGTLTLPDPAEHGEGPYVTAVLITGGGQENRDYYSLGHKPFLVISDYLTRRGIAVMRYDDRGVGASIVDANTPVGKDATSRHFATDTLAVVRHLRTIREIDDDRIGLIGHSEGGLIAPLTYSMDNRIAFLVLLAGPGVRGDAVFRTQVERTWAVQGIDAEAVSAMSALFAQMQTLIVNESPSSEIHSAMQTLAAQMIDAVLIAQTDTGQPQTQRQTLIDRAVAQLEDFDSPWWRYIFAYDPGATLRHVKCPVLAVNGSLDLQVVPEQNLPAIERAVRDGGGDVTIIEYEGLNHVLQPATTGAPAEYARIEITIDEQVLGDIARWIKAKIGS